MPLFLLFLAFCLQLNRPALAFQTVEVEAKSDPTLPYKMRRPTWGIDFQVGMEQFTPDNYESSNHGTLTYGDLDDSEPISLTSVGIGGRLNLPAITLAFGGKFATGSKQLKSTTDSNIAVGSDFQVQRYQIYTDLLVDDVFEEPIFVPYAELAINKFTFRDDGDTVDDSGQLNTSLSTSLGLMLQLNSIDPVNSFESRRNSGLENAYLQISANKSFDSGNPDDPDFSTDWNLGVGLRLEW